MSIGAQLWEHVWRLLALGLFVVIAVVVVRYIEWAIGERDHLMRKPKGDSLL